VSESIILDVYNQQRKGRNLEGEARGKGRGGQDSVPNPLLPVGGQGRGRG